MRMLIRFWFLQFKFVLTLYARASCYRLPLNSYSVHWVCCFIFRRCSLWWKWLSMGKTCTFGPHPCIAATWKECAGTTMGSNGTSYRPVMDKCWASSLETALRSTSSLGDEESAEELHGKNTQYRQSIWFQYNKSNSNKKATIIIIITVAGLRSCKQIHWTVVKL